MLFNSFAFIFAFLPITIIIYFFLNKQKLTLASKAWLVFTSLFFYGWWNIKYIPLILGSMLFNFSIGSALSWDIKYKRGILNRKIILIFGVTCNLLLLGYYKYVDFFISNVNSIAKTDFDLLNIILPLGISFFTFTQIAYLVDAYKNEVREMDFLNYCLFVTFFPHLIAGPILHHSEMMPQFENIRKKVLNYKNLSIGLYLFSVGLFKKVILADSLSAYVHSGFDLGLNIDLISSWITSLAYTFQLYLDFSGYMDMALGLALMFNINFPMNFNLPYKSLDIQDFWRRWHITLGRFLKNYVYIPLGGNKFGEFNACRNLFLTFLIGGLWHGASWMFIVWGALHGIALVILRIWRKFKIVIPKALCWFMTFMFVNVTWVIFRSENWNSAKLILKNMIGLGTIILPEFYGGKPTYHGYFDITIVFIILIGLIIAFFQNNYFQTLQQFKPTKVTLMITTVLLIISLVSMNKGSSEFLYFRF